MIEIMYSSVMANSHTCQIHTSSNIHIIRELNHELRRFDAQTEFAVSPPPKQGVSGNKVGILLLHRRKERVVSLAEGGNHSGVER